MLLVDALFTFPCPHFHFCFLLKLISFSVLRPFPLTCFVTFSLCVLTFGLFFPFFVFLTHDLFRALIISDNPPLASLFISSCHYVDISNLTTFSHVSFALFFSSFSFSCCDVVGAFGSPHLISSFLCFPEFCVQSIAFFSSHLCFLASYFTVCPFFCRLLFHSTAIH